MCGTELADRLGISVALLCHHWEVLADAGLIRKERVGQMRICTLDPDRLGEATRSWEGAPEAASEPAPKKKRARKARG